VPQALLRPCANTPEDSQVEAQELERSLMMYLRYLPSRGNRTCSPCVALHPFVVLPYTSSCRVPVPPTLALQCAAVPQRPGARAREQRAVGGGGVGPGQGHIPPADRPDVVALLVILSSPPPSLSLPRSRKIALFLSVVMSLLSPCSCPSLAFSRCLHLSLSVSISASASLPLLAATSAPSPLELRFARLRAPARRYRDDAVVAALRVVPDLLYRVLCKVRGRSRTRTVSRLPEREGGTRGVGRQ
jgi:hypothetical protein